MRIGNSPFRLVVLFAAAVGIAFFGVLAQAVTEPVSTNGNIRADVIELDALKAYGDLELPMVTFLHDKHTDALELQNKSCEVCHSTYKSEYTGSEIRSPKFKRLADPDRQGLIDLYHTNCMDCHKETTKAGLKSGPITCRDCHTPEPRAASNRTPIGFDRSLHWRHNKAAEEKCETCHHAFNEPTEKLYYDKGKESTCRYCHLEQATEKVSSMKEASHVQCIACHQTILTKTTDPKKAGPVKCSGCHEPLAQAGIKKVDDIPRMKREQPDAALIRIRTPGITGRMTPVPFNHKIHEEKNDTCRVCHHQAMDACVKCHTVTGSKESKGVTLEQSMHRLQSDRSCLGCHQTKQDAKQCAGCHDFMRQERPRDASCLDCHVKLEGTLVERLAPEVEIPAEEERAIAASLLQSRPTVSATYNVDDAPEKVVINVLSDQYEAVEFPHRKIVESLVKELKQNELGQYFHAGQAGLCQGCHHNSPASAKPPRCGSCHGQPFEANEINRPGLKGAYHVQCLGCHKSMAVEKPAATACTECHKEKKPNS
jgi:hypothetical protein